MMIAQAAMRTIRRMDSISDVLEPKAVGREQIGPIHPHLNAEHTQPEVAYTVSMKALVALLLLPVAFLTLSAQQGTSDTGKNASPTNSNQQLQEPPVDVAPEPADPVERALRATRNRLQDSRNPLPSAAGGSQRSDLPSARRSRFDTQPSGPPGVVFVDRMPFRPNTRPEDFQLPVSESDTILLGSVSKVQPARFSRISRRMVSLSETGSWKS